MRPVATTSSPSAGLNRKPCTVVRQITASILALSSLRREIAVAGGMRAAKARDLAAQAHVAVGAFQRALDGAGQLRHRVFREIGAHLRVRLDGLAGGAHGFCQQLASGFERHYLNDT